MGEIITVWLRSMFYSIGQQLMRRDVKDAQLGDKTYIHDEDVGRYDNGIISTTVKHR